jgi:hypothetical protein
MLMRIMPPQRNGIMLCQHSLLFVGNRMNLQRQLVPSSSLALGRWVVISTLMIVFSTLGAGYSTILWYGSGLSAFIRMIGIPSLCVGIAQYFLLASVRPPFWRWIVTSTISAAIGLGLSWMLVLISITLLNTYGTHITIQSGKLATAIISGSVCGLITGGVTGICVSLGQWVALRPYNQLTRAWIGANMICWGFGLAVIGALVFGILSQASFSF